MMHTLNKTMMDPELYLRFRLSYSPATFAYIQQRTGVGASSPVLDLACGPGVVTRELLSWAATVWTLDQSITMLRGAQAYLRSSPLLLLAQGDGERMPFAADSFQLVTIGQAIHWFNLRKLVPELRRVLRVGGWLAVLSRYPSPETSYRSQIEHLMALAQSSSKAGLSLLQLTEAKAIGNLNGLEAFGFRRYQREVFTREAQTSLETYLEGYLERAHRQKLSDERLKWFTDQARTLLTRACPDGIVRERYFDYVITAQKAG